MRPTTSRLLSWALVLAVAVLLLEVRPAGACSILQQDAPADSPLWWTLTDEVSPAELRRSCSDPREHQRRYLDAVYRGEAADLTNEDLSELVLYLDGRRNPELVPLWRAFAAFAMAIERYPDLEPAALLGGAEVEVSGEGAESLVAAARWSRRRALELESEVGADRRRLVALFESFRQQDGERLAQLVEAVGRSDLDRLVRLTGEPKERMADLLAARALPPAQTAAVEAVTALSRRMSRQDWNSMRRLLLTSVAPGLRSLSLSAEETLEAVSLDLFQERLVGKGVWGVHGKGTAVYDCKGNCPHFGWKLNAECFMTDDYHGGVELPNADDGQPQVLDAHHSDGVGQGEELIDSLHEELTCEDVNLTTQNHSGNLHRACWPGTEDSFSYRLWAQAAVRDGTKFKRIVGQLDGQSRCVDHQDVGGSIEWLGPAASGQELSLVIQAWDLEGERVVNEHKSRVTADFDFTGPFEDDWTYELLIIAKPSAYECFVENERGTIPSGPVDISITCGPEIPLGVSVCGLGTGQSASLNLQLTVGQATKQEGLSVSSNSLHYFELDGMETARWQLTGDGTCTVEPANGVLTAESSSILAEVDCSKGRSSGRSACDPTAYHSISFVSALNDIQIGGGVVGGGRVSGPVQQSSRSFLPPASFTGTLNVMPPDPLDPTPPPQTRVVTQSGVFPFLRPVESGSEYRVTAENPSPGLSCEVREGSGTLTGDVSNVRIECSRYVVPRDWCDAAPELCVVQDERCTFWWQYEGRSTITTTDPSGNVVGTRVTNYFSLQSRCTPGSARHSVATSATSVAAGPLVYLRTELSGAVEGPVVVRGVARHDEYPIGSIDAYLDGQPVALSNLRWGQLDAWTCDEIPAVDCDQYSAFSGTLDLDQLGVAPGVHDLLVVAANTAPEPLVGGDQLTFLVAGEGGEPDPPSGLTTTPGEFPDRIVLRWSASPSVTSYDLYRSLSAETGFSLLASTTGLSHADLGLSPGDRFFYRLEACNLAGCSAPSLTIEGSTTVGVLPPPPSVSASDRLYVDRIDVSWPAVAGATSYSVWRGITGLSAQADQVAVTANSSWSDTGLGPGESYYYWVRSQNSQETSSFSQSDLGSTASGSALPAPANLVASDGVYPDRVALTWDGVAGTVAYQVFRFAGPTESLATMIGTATATSYDDLGLAPGLAYFYWVKACDSHGCSDFSDAEPGSTGVVGPPPVPGSVLASDGTHPDRVSVTWVGSAEADSYDVYRGVSSDPAQAASIAAGVGGGAYWDTSVVPGTEYHYFVRARNEGGVSALSSSDSGYAGSLPTVPDPPTGVAASDGEYADRILVTWSAASGAASYRVHRSAVVNSGFTLVGTSVSPGFTDLSVGAGESWYYRVKACNAAGCSLFSAADQGSSQGVLPVPPAPGSISASDGTFVDRIVVSWAGVAQASTYELLRSSSAQSGQASVIATVAGTAYTDSGHAASASFHYWVRACNASGCSSLSPMDQGSTGAASQPPSAPAGVAASDGTFPDRIDVSWSVTSGAASYEVYRFASPSPSFASRIATVTTASYSDLGHVRGQVYYYWVKACNSAGCSALSSYDQGSTAPPIAPPPVPTEVSASDGLFNDRVMLVWVGSLEAETYEVYRSTVDDPSGAVQIANGVTVAPYWDLTAPVGITYFYWLKAKSSGGTSAFSASDSGYAQSSGGSGF